MDSSETKPTNNTHSQTPTGQLGSPHFLPKPTISNSVSISSSDREILKQQIDSDQVQLSLDASVFASGMNGALTRKFNLETSSVELLGKAGMMPKWKPTRSRVKTFGMTFPDGLEFIPPKKEKEHSEESDQIKGPTAPDTENSEKPKAIRLKPPANALSLEDRLFYLLQPPLQSWLAGQELLMPFEPFPYQYEGIAWLFSQKSALLADEMGLGKTMQTITGVRLLLRSGQVRRILLLCPKPLIPNWQREFKFWAEELPVTIVQGDSNRRKMIWELPNTPILIANYESMARDFESMGEENIPRFDLVVLDEAQRIKNRDSRTAEITRLIPRKRSWALTGTPIENRHEEMSSLFEWMEVVPPKATPDLRQLQVLSKEFILRRTKDLVMTDLPPRLDRPAHLDLNPAQQIAYETAEKDGVIQLNEMGDSITVQHVFELVLRLKQITNFDPVTGESSKLDRLEADMEEIAASGGKAILFSQWTKPLDFMAERLERFGTLVYHGGIPTKKREPILDQFKHDPSSHLLLMSYGTGAVGLNLQFAGYVFLFDRWWNPAIEDQAINRAHRIGQKTQVIVTKFICNNTIEERIDLVLQQKRELFHAILGDGDTTCESRSLTAAEIFGLFDLKQKKGDVTTKIAPQVPQKPAA